MAVLFYITTSTNVTMAMFEALTQRLHQQGISIPNIEYAINAVKDGVRRQHRPENLTADYRGMSLEQGNALLPPFIFSMYCITAE